MEGLPEVPENVTVPETCMVSGPTEPPQANCSDPVVPEESPSPSPPPESSPSPELDPEHTNGTEKSFPVIWSLSSSTNQSGCNCNKSVNATLVADATKGDFNTLFNTTYFLEVTKEENGFTCYEVSMGSKAQANVSDWDPPCLSPC
jgi:hypothetical protein